MYKVQLDQFEGPLDLLLYFIRRDEIDIYDIPISNITSEYLQVIEDMKTMNLSIAGEFILMAATLMKIKSKPLKLQMRMKMLKSMKKKTKSMKLFTKKENILYINRYWNITLFFLL